ncbi:hypothetical protein QJS10_CPA01g02311 [Acorus calamus]|uniref:RNase H type-1 domain-containing protein n=1 Tax=Acorus calamus TaxID=4465 RepID=A0AAV9FED0_ACOCL|nr:hypothetical protein QJS10_CPA01g02311 [Acorus calamus]
MATINHLELQLLQVGLHQARRLRLRRLMFQTDSKVVEGWFKEANQAADLLAAKEVLIGHSIIHPDQIWPTLQQILISDRE